MSNIRLFFPKSLSLNLTSKLDKPQSHYISKVMRIKLNEVFSLFNSLVNIPLLLRLQTNRFKNLITSA